MGKRKNHLGKALACAYVVASPSVAASNSFDHCPDIWSDYVLIVRDLLASSEGDLPPVLFVGTGGQIHNCLGENLAPHLLGQVNSYHNAVSRLFDGDLDVPSSEWPGNICTVGDTESSAFSYLWVGLPYTPEILSKDICRVRIEKSLARRIER